MAKRSTRHITRRAVPRPNTDQTTLQSQSRPRPRRAPVRRWKPTQSAVASGIAIAGVAFLFLLARSAHYSNPPAPSTTDFTLIAYQGQDVLGGDQVRFSHVLGEGKPVVLNFFAGACAPCSQEMPGLQRVADDYQGRVTFVGVDVGPFVGMGSHDDALHLLKQLGIRYPAAYAVDTIPLTLYVQGMPTTVVFDAKGHFATKVTGAVTEDQLRKVLSSL